MILALIAAPTAEYQARPWAPPVQHTAFLNAPQDHKARAKMVRTAAARCGLEAMTCPCTRACRSFPAVSLPLEKQPGRKATSRPRAGQTTQAAAQNFDFGFSMWEKRELGSARAKLWSVSDEEPKHAVATGFTCDIACWWSQGTQVLARPCRRWRITA